MLENTPAPVDPDQLRKKNAPPPGSSLRTKAQVIAFVNQKGGTGKTTITQNLAVCLAQEHHQRVLCLDLDPQGNLGHSLVTEPIITTRTADRLLLVPTASIGEYIIPARAAVDLIPNRYQRDLRENVERLPLSENLLRRHLSHILTLYDFILIDTPAGLNRTTRAGIDVANQIILVVSCGSYTLRGISSLVSWIGDISAMQGRRTPALRVVLNYYDERQRFDRELARELQAVFGESLFQTRIRPSVRIVEAAARSMSVIEYLPTNGGAADFRQLSREILGLPLNALSSAEQSGESSSGDDSPLTYETLPRTGSSLKLVC
jgi:chromosome partitioning protein